MIRERAHSRQVGGIVDLLVRICFLISCTSLVIILMITIFEITMRYFFDSPTKWVSDSVRYLLAFMIMFGLPDVTRRNEHVSISLFLDKLRLDHPLRRLLFVISACVCLFVTYLAVDIALTQFSRNLYTQGTWRIPRVWITGSVATGFSVAALAFATLAIWPKRKE
ncbi:TRAP transporter small permease [Rhodovulum sulfidophilum]|uniref:TRAP transporter small permease protein n=1 Tax=Rhodovulum sulfidophilum TaxID=35806 RepID=A0ABS1RTG7_RHOSU|nr:TRAP transporter small permease [Rhodovulum sulfidophilum]MBL3609377.1 TRAP transporter small permease [Rhodovulum sulfidophilum]MCE8455543.1 TRAP transporter small permease [Rhodovulum sulfidophilum]